MAEDSIPKNEEVKELLSSIQTNNRLRIFVFGGFVLLELLLKWMSFLVPWSVIGITTLLFSLNFIYEYLVKSIWQKQTVTQVSLGYLIFHTIEIISLLIAIHFFGALVMGGMAVLMVYILFCYLAFTRRKYPRIIALISVVGYIAFVGLEYFGVLEFYDVFDLGMNPAKNRGLFITNTAFMTGFLLTLAIYGDIFSKKLRDSIGLLKIRTEQLAKGEKELDEARATLEIKVKARTKELRHLAESLEEKVKQRTEELQEKVKELEKFQKFAVGRELKMVELKGKVKKLESKVKKQKVRKK